MTIERLPPTTALSVLLDVNANLAPYFTKFYQDTKLAGDTPEVFLLRVTKKMVVDHYLLNHVRNETEAHRLVYDNAITALMADADLIDTEVS